MSLQSRPRGKSSFLTPAPGEYNVDKAEKTISESAPKYTFGLKSASEKLSQTPGKFLETDPTEIYGDVENSCQENDFMKP